MKDFIKKYWVQTAYALLCTIVTGFLISANAVNAESVSA